MRFLALTLAIGPGCTASHRTVDEALASLSTGYHCGLDWYVAYDADRTVRLQASLLALGYDDPEPVEDSVAATLGQVATLTVYTGSCLWTPGCSDDVSVPDCGNQQLDHVYDAVAGEAELSRHADGWISGLVTDLVLEDRRGDAPAEISELELFRVPLGAE